MSSDWSPQGPSCPPGPASCHRPLLPLPFSFLAALVKDKRIAAGGIGRPAVKEWAVENNTVVEGKGTVSKVS